MHFPTETTAQPDVKVAEATSMATARIRDFMVTSLSVQYARHLLRDVGLGLDERVGDALLQ